MQTITDYKKLNKATTAIALGNFDGVHIGHKKLIDEIVFSSRRNGLKSLLWSFKKHPENIIKGDGWVKSITALDEKIDLFGELGLDFLYLEDFEKIREYSPDEFINKILIDQFNAKLVVVGFNFRFGKNAEGDSNYLKETLESKGIPVKIISPVIYCDTLVSSSAIRAYIEKGDMEAASLYLGRQFFINFPVVHGECFGRTIGIPTINQLFPKDHIVPKTGVYATLCYINGDPYIGVCNVGMRPTVNDNGKITCETHILDFVGSVYGQKIKVCFYKRLRDEIKFDSVDALVKQVKCDIEETRRYFNLHF